MSRRCDLTGKIPQTGHKVSHSNRKTKRRWNPNIQRVRASFGGATRRLNACTGCIKAGKVQKVTH